jgi:hypothetical protein
VNDPARVLVVEDEEAIAQGLVFNLERKGYAVEVSGDGLDALPPERRGRALFPPTIPHSLRPISISLAYSLPTPSLLPPLRLLSPRPSDEPSYNTPPHTPLATRQRAAPAHNKSSDTGLPNSQNPYLSICHQKHARAVRGLSACVARSYLLLTLLILYSWLSHFLPTKTSGLAQQPTERARTTPPAVDTVGSRLQVPARAEEGDDVARRRMEDAENDVAACVCAST